MAACLLAGCVAAVADEPAEPQGWATVDDGTTGGCGGMEYVVATAEEFSQAIRANSPKIIRIAAAIRLTEPARLTSDTTVLGMGRNVRITGGGFHLRRVHNIVLQNLAIVAASDAIGIEESHHIWVDHCDLSNCQDGLLDIKRGSDFITVSWNRFHDHHKTCLLGHSDKADIRSIDRGHLRVTYHHNFFDGTKTRHPRVRFADGVHVFNNYFRKNEYGVASVMDAGVIVESNVFEDVASPTLTAYGDSPLPGRLIAANNLLIRSGDIQTRGTVDANLLTYKYSVDPAESIPALVSAHAGIRDDDGSIRSK